MTYFTFIKNFLKFKRTNDGRFPLSWKNRKVCLRDDTETTNFDRHYVYHPAWAARILAETKPAKHVDISSTLHFSTMLSAFIPTEFYDYRPAEIVLSNLQSKKADLCALPFPDGSIASLSCMHTVEHIGLGRYGDPIDPKADLKAMRELARVIKSGGNFLFVVPIGKPKIIWNAHRIYSYKQIIESFPTLTLKEFSLIPENPKDGGIIKNASEEAANNERYGCGCFWFKKL